MWINFQKIYDNDYFYDSNGNMTADKNKNIQLISGHHYNLPDEVVKNLHGKLKYFCTASGQKLSQEVSDWNKNFQT